jgi:hypothetical protein
VGDDTRQPTTVNLVVEINSDGTPFYESILVEPLGDDRYRVRASPGLLEGLAAGDEIELALEEFSGFRLVHRGGNLCIQFFWPEHARQCVADLEPKVRALGGWLDGETPGLLVFTVPVAAGFPGIERIFFEAEQLYPGSRWMYGNVYDPADGVTPLNWW